MSHSTLLEAAFAPPQPGVDDKSPAPASSRDLPTLRLLLLDDSPFEAKVISYILAKSAHTRFDVVHAKSLGDAVERLGKERFDALLVDLMLTDAEGFDTIRRIVEVEPDTPVIVLTRVDDDETALRAIEAGVQDYLVKNESIPFVLARAIRLATERQRLLVALREARREAHRLATHDRVTGLPNRFLLEDRLLTALRSARRYGRQFAVLFIDLDDFKAINDEAGHHAGDAALRAMSEVLRESVRGSDTAARYAGDEFVVVQNEVSGLEDVERLVERIFTGMAATGLHPGSSPRPLRASIGVALFPADGETGEALLQAADRAMYRAKELGGNQWVAEEGAARSLSIRAAC